MHDTPGEMRPHVSLPNSSMASKIGLPSLICRRIEIMPRMMLQTKVIAGASFTSRLRRPRLAFGRTVFPALAVMLTPLILQAQSQRPAGPVGLGSGPATRSEERRVGKEC